MFSYPFLSDVSLQVWSESNDLFCKKECREGSFVQFKVDHTFGLIRNPSAK